MYVYVISENRRTWWAGGGITSVNIKVVTDEATAQEFCATMNAQGTDDTYSYEYSYEKFKLNQGV